MDLRHPNDAVLDAMTTAFEAALRRIVDDLRLERELTLIWQSSAVTFSPELIAMVEEGARRSGLSHMRCVAGASHDAGNLARVAPTTMIFVPSLNGISHNVAEFTSKEECAAGTQVLLNAVLAFDDTLV